jgi:hypothetical protein
MILGLTIPRLYTSFIATKVMVTDVNTSMIQPISAKKYYSNNSLKTTVEERSKDWGGDSEESRFWVNQFRWNTML